MSKSFRKGIPIKKRPIEKRMIAEDVETFNEAITIAKKGLPEGGTIWAQGLDGQLKKWTDA